MARLDISDAMQTSSGKEAVNQSGSGYQVDADSTGEGIVDVNEAHARVTNLFRLQPFSIIASA